MGQLVKTGFGDKLHSPAKIAAIVEALTAEGIAPDQALRGVNLRKDELYAPATRVSLNQMIEACRNASRLSRDPQIAFRAGAALHVSAYGMYGYAMLRAFGGRNDFVLSSSGHIQSLINPPTNTKAKFFLNPELGVSPDDWLKEARQMNGTWWVLWRSWASERSGSMRPAPTTFGSERYTPIEKAPGSYALEP